MEVLRNFALLTKFFFPHRKPLLFKRQGECDLISINVLIIGFSTLAYAILTYAPENRLVPDYPTFSGFALEKWFRLKMMESHQYSDIGSWWERKKGKEANEIDIVALSIDGNNAIVAEVKRQQRNYNHKLFMEEVGCIKASILFKYKMETRMLTLGDM